MIDSAALANAATPKFCGYNEEPCTFDKPVQGVCPDGWHVPGTGSSDFTTYSFGSTYSVQGPIAYQSHLTSGDPLKRKEMTYDIYSSYRWSAKDISKVYASDLYLPYMDDTSSDPKYFGLPVRCIKDYPEEVTP